MRPTPCLARLLVTLCACLAMAACGEDGVELNADGSPTNTPDLSGPGQPDAVLDGDPAEDLGAPDSVDEDAVLSDETLPEDDSSVDALPEDVTTEDGNGDDTITDDTSTEDTPSDASPEEDAVAASGACCTAEGCAILEDAACESLGATFHGAGSTCEQACPVTGACCDGSSQCAMTTASACEGDYKGDRFECGLGVCLTEGPLGACCGAGLCTVTTSGTCALGGGTWHEGLTCDQADCSNPNAGACCNRFVCLITQESTCIGPGANWQGAGTSCDDCP